jgi:hypothetical protein
MRSYIKELTKSRGFVKDKDMMIANLACCTPEHTVRQSAEMMVRHDCGEIANSRKRRELETDWRDHRS